MNRFDILEAVETDVKEQFDTIAPLLRSGGDNSLLWSISSIRVDTRLRMYTRGSHTKTKGEHNGKDHIV